MTVVSDRLHPPSWRRDCAWLAVGALVAIALLCSAWQLGSTLPPTRWLAAAVSPAPRTAELVVHFSVLPRLAVAFVAGAGLGLSGALFQHVLDNPLASPATMGVPAGAQLGLTALALVAPSALSAWADLAALLGGLAAVAVSLLVAARHRFAPILMILAGLAVGLFCGALATAMRLFNQEDLAVVTLWSAGTLDQVDWSVATRLLSRCGLVAVALLVLLRPLHLLGLGDGHARALGVPPGWLRVAALGLAVVVSASVTAAVGPLAFVDLAAPWLARSVGARRLGARLALAPLLGGALLVIVDTAVRAVDAAGGLPVPVGAATALLAAPLMLALLPRLRGHSEPTAAGWMPRLHRHPAAPVLIVLALATVAATLAACGIGRTVAGGPAFDALLPWRLPRLVEAFAAGAMLATAGALLQRATGNLLASPEVLGLGAAVTAGFAVVVFVAPEPTGPLLVAGGAAAAIVLAAVQVGGSWGAGFAADRMLLTGVALTSCVTAGVTACLALSDGRARLLLTLLSGSTAGAQALGAVAALAAAVVLVPASLMFVRCLDLLPLGDAAARSLGVAVGPARAGLLAMAALLTAVATLTAGPLTFVGLLGPHVARRLGLHGAAAELPGAALVGGLVMLLADWLGRIVFAPFELPAGLVAAVIGCPYLVFQLRRRG